MLEDFGVLMVGIFKQFLIANAKCSTPQSNVALECILQSHPNMVICGEEVAASKLNLFDLTQQICDAVQARAGQEGLIESIPEVYALLKEIHGLLRQGVVPENISSQLSPWPSALFEFLPPFIRIQIETEKLLAHLVEAEMNKRLKEGPYKGKKFNAIWHFFGYQARGSLPSKFLDNISYHIFAAGLNGCMVTVTNLKNPVNKWCCGAAPLTVLPLKLENLLFILLLLISKAKHMSMLLRQSALKFLMDDLYRNPGPLHFDGPGADAKAVALSVEDQDYMGRIKELNEYLEKVRIIVKPGCLQEVLKAPLSVMASITESLRLPRPLLRLPRLLPPDARCP
ncbi:hypothetical protein Tsubulata_025704, partial [Turnera subulata]